MLLLSLRFAPGFSPGISVLLEGGGVLLNYRGECGKVSPPHASHELEVGVEVLGHAGLEERVARGDLPRKALYHDEELGHNNSEGKAGVRWRLAEAEGELGESLGVFEPKGSDPAMSEANREKGWARSEATSRKVVSYLYI
jgi:hypothetical protein